MHGNFLPEIRERVSDGFVIGIACKQLLNTVIRYLQMNDDIIIAN